MNVSLKSIALAGAFAAGVILIATPIGAAADPSAAAAAGFDRYVAQLELRLASQHSSTAGFLAPADQARLRQGEIVTEQVIPASGSDLPGALLHHWRATAFVPGATAADLEKLLRDYGRYPQVYAPQVETAKVLAHSGNHYQTALRLEQKHVITVVLDTTYDIEFVSVAAAPGEHFSPRGYSISQSTRIAEIASPGTASEHALDSAHEHGLLWRLNTYWSWEERDGGLYMQVETVSLTRAVPAGLGWAVGPFIESIPRESLVFTLESTAKALRR